MSLFTDFAVLVIHHDSPETLLSMVAQLERDGIPLSAIIVMDNSGDSAAREVAMGVGDQITVVRVPNEGYGAAVNRGARQLRDHGLPLRAPVLVCTHELQFAPGAAGALMERVTEPGVVAAGPALAGYRGRHNRIWSAGGQLTRWAMVPRHRLCGASTDALSSLPVPYRAEWLDGACVAYQLGTLLSEPLDERYFLYFEEVDLHLRIARLGALVVVPTAIVQQQTSGTPAYYLIRNYLLFTSGRASAPQRITGCALISGRWLPSLRRPSDLASLIRGMTDYFRGRWGPEHAA